MLYIKLILTQRIFHDCTETPAHPLRFRRTGVRRLAQRIGFNRRNPLCPPQGHAGRQNIHFKRRHHSQPALCRRRVHRFRPPHQRKRPRHQPPQLYRLSEFSVRRARLEADINHAELSRAARLFFMLALSFRRFGYRFAIRDFRIGKNGFAPEFAL